MKQVKLIIAAIVIFALLSVVVTNSVYAIDHNTIDAQKTADNRINGLIFGFAKMNDIQDIGIYGELDDPQIPQYRSAKSILQTLEKLTYQKFGSLEEFDVMADSVDNEIHR